MNGLEQDARDELRGRAGEIRRLGRHLLALHDRLPVSPRADVMLLGEEDPDFATETRRSIECALNDQIEPLIENLLATTGYAAPTELPETQARKEAMPKHIPQDILDEERWMREALRSAVARSPLSHAEIEQALGLNAGTLDALFAGTVELGVRHLFGILRVLRVEMWQFLQEGRPVPGEQAGAQPGAAR